MKAEENRLPSDFLKRRFHSLLGLFLVFYIIFHLYTNSLSALPFGSDGKNFVASVNAIHDTPYLIVLEVAILALPILLHMIWGIRYLLTSSYNSFGFNGHTPYLPEYPRNHAYTWQRITSWALIFLIIGHVVHMRFIESPTKLNVGNAEDAHMVRLTADDGLYTLAKRLNVELYDSTTSHNLMDTPHDLKPGEVIAVANSFGAAELLMVRDTFKMPIMVLLYSLLVLAACFHAFNGLWTFMISWGVTLTEKSQRLMRHAATWLMVAVTLLGLSSIWLTYWNLKG